MKNKEEDYIVLILTHGRPDNVRTVDSLRKHGYTGSICLVMDDTDKKIDQYKINYPDISHYVFNKETYIKQTDVGDNFGKSNVVVFARNAAFDIARDLGYEYFIVLDDDYTSFRFRFDNKLKYDVRAKRLNQLDKAFDALLGFFKADERIATLSIAQGGDFIAGKDNKRWASAVKLHRKSMNLFVCSIHRPFKFMGYINEDATCYTILGSQGRLFFTTNSICLEQGTTQANSGGLTEAYLNMGTYVKSFYTILWAPSATKMMRMGNKYKRIHHQIKWNNAAPKILDEKWKKA